MHGSSHIQLHDDIQNKRAVINPKNEDDECFKWAVTIGTNLDKIKYHPEKITRQVRELAKQYNFDGINFPVEVDNCVYKKILKQNDITFNVY